MTVTTNSSVSVTSSFSYSGLGVSIVFYFEPVNIIAVNHKVEDELIDTNKNLSNILMSTSTNYDATSNNYAPKSFASLNKNFWPGYILTGYTVYKNSVSNSNIIAVKTFDVNTTSLMNSQGNDKRYVTLLTAINSASDINGAQIVQRENIGYGNDKIIVFHYLYPEVEIKNINYNTGKILKDINNNNLTYTIKLNGDNMLIKSLDTTNPKNGDYYEMNIVLADGRNKQFLYNVSDFSLVQAWIYTKDLNKQTKTLYKVIAGNNTFKPTNVSSSKIEMADDFASFANMYVLNTEELMTVMNKVWSDLYIEFRYFEGANVVNVSYIDEEGNVLMPPETVKILDKVNGRYTATIPVTEIDGYELIRYNLDGKDDNNVSSLEKVNIVDNGTDRELIFVYRKTPDDNVPETYDYPFAIIRSNDRGDEEYNVDVAMPTEEDLYANVVTDSYLLENVLSILSEKQKVNVILKKKYYTSNDDNNTGITSSIDIAYATIPLEYELEYNYFGGGNADLFILENAIIDNEAVNDTKHYDENGKVLIEADYDENVPTLTYLPGGVLTINNSEECTLIKDGDIYYLEVMLSGIDYEKPDMNSIVKTYENNHVVIDNIIRNNAVVNGDYLSVTAEGQEIIYLNGNGIYMSANRLANAAELANAGYYYIASKAPLINGDVLFNNRNVYTYLKSKNDTYESTKLTVNYKAHEEVKEKKVTSAITGEKRVKEYYPDDILMNSITIYTPIVNYSELLPYTNTGANDNQLIDEGIQNVLTLDSVFSILIPHDGMHIYAVNNTGDAYDGYGNKDYNYNGALLNDEEEFASKGLRNTTFAKMKLVKFSFDVYVIKYADDGETVQYKKLILANTWFNLGAINSNTGLSIEKYNFIIPTWVTDNCAENITVRIVAGNTPEEYDIYADEAEYIVTDVANKTDAYILETKFDVYIAGSLYDIEIRDSDDIGWVGKLARALKLSKLETDTKNLFLPIGQNNQNYLAYNLGLKLGYRFYFDLKTKGTASDEIVIKPTIYYVPSTGGEATKDISLFYDTETKKYIKLNLENDLDIQMVMVSTHGNVNNSGFDMELIYGKINNLDKNYKIPTIIGSIFEKLTLIDVDTKLPRDNISESANLYGYGSNINAFIKDAEKSEIVEDENSIRNSAGHWYGEFYLPSSTKVVLGSDVETEEVVANQGLVKNDGYLIVVFEEVITKDNGNGYLSYSMPRDNSRWEKEGTIYELYEINLPNGNKATIPGISEGAAMAIYETTLSASDDHETEGTH